MTHVDRTIAEPSMVQQLEVESYAPRQRRLAAAHEHGAQEQHALIDQPVPERLRARAAPPMLRSALDVSLSFRTAAGSNCRSILVRAVDTSSSVEE